MARSWIIAFWVAATASAAFGHEFWIEPREFQVENGSLLEADLRNGENFRGSPQPFIERRFSRFEFALGEDIGPVVGRMGDVPAAAFAAQGDGLGILLHETTPLTLTYTQWEKFLAFAAHKDFPTAATDHAAEGWPQTGFRESYTRHAKALVDLGSGAGADRAFGLQTEFVAQTNPYDPGFDGDMIVQLFYQNIPRADAQVEIFDRAPDGQVTVALTRTDAQGIATIPVRAGHDYLLDAVVLRKAADAGTEPKAPVWETLWAALTFHVPG